MVMPACAASTDERMNEQLLTKLPLRGPGHGTGISKQNQRKDTTEVPCGVRVRVPLAGGDVGAERLALSGGDGTRRPRVFGSRFSGRGSYIAHESIVFDVE